MNIPHSLAQMLGSVAEAASVDMGVAMAVSIVDREGGLQFFLRMDEALPASTEIAMSKAYTAAALRMTTEELGRLASPGGPLYGIEHTHSGRIVLFGGGIPLQLHGQVVGGIGISGGTVEEDVQVAQTVVKVFEEMQEWSDRIGPFLPSGLFTKEALVRLDKYARKVFRNETSPLPEEFLRLFIGALLLAVGKTGSLQFQTAAPLA